MLDWIRDTLAWFEAHPAVIAWLCGWLAGISAGEFAKRMLPLSMDKQNMVRASQLAAVVVGATIAFLIWPRIGPNRLAFALCVGMSAPFAYEKALDFLAWKWPGLAQRATVAAVMERRAAKVNPDDTDKAGA